MCQFVFLLSIFYSLFGLPCHDSSVLNILAKLMVVDFVVVLSFSKWPFLNG